MVPNISPLPGSVGGGEGHRFWSTRPGKHLVSALHVTKLKACARHVTKAPAQEDRWVPVKRPSAGATSGQPGAAFGGAGVSMCQS